MVKQMIMPAFDPVGAIWALMVASIIVLLLRKQRQCALWLCVPVVLMVLIGSTPLVKALVAAEESHWRKPVVAECPAGDVVVCLGGAHSVSDRDPLGFSVNRAGDRLLAAFELVRTGKADVLVLGGNWPRKNHPGSTMVPVEHWMESLNTRPGVTYTNLGICLDTHDEASAMKNLGASRQWRKILLVTSALHMRRAESVFRKAGFEVVPVPCDFQVCGVDDTEPFSPIPRQERFDLLGLYIHETIGRVVYRIRGW